MTISQKIEALLFYTTEPMTYKKIAKIFDVAEDVVREGISILQQQLEGRGIVLIENNGEVMLATHPDMSDLIEQLRRKELGARLSKVALETLTIITYQNGITKSDIDYIRGVNSNFILRNLLMRGLIERVPNPEDKRSPLYQPTIETLGYLGVQSVDQLPEYETLQQRITDITQDQYEEIIEETAKETTETSQN